MRRFSFLLGVGLGIIATLRVKPELVDRARTGLDNFLNSDPVQNRKQAIKASLGAMVRKQGRMLTDRAANAIKDRYFPENPKLIEGTIRDISDTNFEIKPYN